MELQALPSRIGQVRRIVSAQLRYWHLDPLIDKAALGVTELLTNVHLHARTDKTCTVEIELLLDRLTVSVRDHDPRIPVVAEATPEATTGRGLSMVAAMSESWGVRPDGDAGKVVWFTLPTTAATARPAPPVRPVVHSVPEKAAPVFVELEPAGEVGRAPAHAPAGSAVAG
ncbi:ATP-binding protein [Streptomyces mangrovisoli]|uniref:ATP-binding protein n=1 Tax=Streptomyces mangrovisoli TaxID=1428628 RepID=A0A1J4P4X1_9ACTN|nr:ATP-binding protein [Streptomyces mangrovisoli]